MQETSATVRKFCKLLLKVATYESLLCSGKKIERISVQKKISFQYQSKLNKLSRIGIPH